MKIHLNWIHATAAVAIVAVGTHAALGQYAPYGTTQYGAAPQTYSASQPYAAPQQYAAPQTYIPPAQTSVPQQYPQTSPYGTPAYNASAVAAQGYSTPVTIPAPAYTAQPARPTAYLPTTQTPSYAARPQLPALNPSVPYPQTAMRTTYPTLAQNNSTPTPTAGAAPSGSEVLPTPEPITNGNNSGTSMNGSSNMGSPNMGSSMSGAQAAPGYDMNYPNTGAGCSCGAGGYPATGDCGTSSCGCGQQDYGISSYFDRYCGGRQWFGGVYYLYMDRTNPSDSRLAVRFDTNNPTYPYYPQSQTTVLRTNDADDGFRSGGEIRFGSTFGIGSACDTCNSAYSGCNGCCGCNACANQEFAWEAAWWALDKDVTTASYTDQTPDDNIQVFGMKNFAGVFYTRPGGNPDVPLNNYTNYSNPILAAPATPPIDGDIRTVSVSVRTSFAVDNIELNFLRLPMSCGCVAPVCNSGCGGYGDGGLGGYGGCGGCGGCQQACCCSPFTLTGLCGVRFLRIDDDFRLGDTFRLYDSVNGNTDGNIFFDRSVDNLLTGFQWGANMNYCVACRWNFFCDSSFGIFDNHMNVYQHFSDDLGGTFATPTYRSSKDDVAFLGELRIGGAYDITCNWRAVLAYRAVGITGLASAADLPDFTDVADAQHINSDRSVLIHGIQAGVECRY